MVLLPISILLLLSTVNCNELEPLNSAPDIPAINNLARKSQINLDPRLRKALLRVLTRLDQEDNVDNSSEPNFRVVSQEDFLTFFQKEKQDAQQTQQQEMETLTEVLPTPQNTKVGKSIENDKSQKSDSLLKNINIYGLKTQSLNQIPTTDQAKTGFFFRLPIVVNDTIPQNSSTIEAFFSEESQNIRETNSRGNQVLNQNSVPVEPTKDSPIVMIERLIKNDVTERVLAPSEDSMQNENGEEMEDMKEEMVTEERSENEESLAETSTELMQKKNVSDNPELKLEGKVEISQAPLVVAFTVQQDSIGRPHKVIPLSYRKPGENLQTAATKEKPTSAVKLVDPNEINFYKSFSKTSSLFKQNPSLSESQPFASIDQPLPTGNEQIQQINQQLINTQGSHQQNLVSQDSFIGHPSLTAPTQPAFINPPINNIQPVSFVPAPIIPQPTFIPFSFPTVMKQDGFIPFQPSRAPFYEPKFNQQLYSLGNEPQRQNFIGGNDLQPLRQQHFNGGNEIQFQRQSFNGGNEIQPLRQPFNGGNEFQAQRQNFFDPKYNQQIFNGGNDLQPIRNNIDEKRRFPLRNQNVDFQRSVEAQQLQRRPSQNFFPQPQIEQNRVNRKEPQQYVGNFGFNTPQRYQTPNQYFQYQTPNYVDNQLRHLFYQSGIINGIENGQRLGGGAEDLNIVTKVLALNHVGRNELNEPTVSESTRNQVKIRPPSRLIEPPFE